MQEAPFVAPTPPSEELFETDPMGFMKAKMVYDKEVSDYNKKSVNYKSCTLNAKKSKKNNSKNILLAKPKLLHEKLPELANPEKEAAYKGKAIKSW